MQRDTKFLGEGIIKLDLDKSRLFDWQGFDIRKCCIYLELVGSK